MSLAQSTDHQENTNIGCRIVHRNGGAGHGNVSLRASCDIDIVVTRAVVTNILQRLGEKRNQFRIERTGVLSREYTSLALQLESYLGRIV